MHVILMGPQGSGKGTQSERVRARLNLGSIATGELFRAAIKGGTALGRKIQAVYDRGELVPDDLTVALVEERLDQLGQERSRGARIDGALYDGFPRTIAQADALSRALAARGEELTAVIAIDVPRETLIERLAGRRVCSGCGRVYNILSDPPAVDGVCNVCGGGVIQRADDTPEAVAKRLDLYEQETAPLVDRYEAQGLVERVDGNRPIADVTESIVAAIQSRMALPAARVR
ncbi:MAG TPA: adenylate kinase [Thermomicrobiales bacterium]|jgi:adenylate kinase|nr:adenylate kinase [Thermomicrobiales bacterium]